MSTAGRLGICTAALLAAAGCESEPATPAEAADGVFGEQVRALDDARAVEVLDLGCGPGDITLRIAERYPDSEVHGLDGSAAMLDFAERARSRSPAGARVRFIRGLVPGAELPRASYDAVVSNSLLHHLHEPAVLWRSIRKLAAPGGPIMVMDLMRARSRAHAAELVDEYAAGEPEVLRVDFYNSLLAAFEPEEVRGQLAAAGLEGLRVEPVSDRHLAVWGAAPAS